MDRRNFLKRISAATTGLALAPLAVVEPVGVIYHLTEGPVAITLPEPDFGGIIKSYSDRTPLDTLIMGGIAVQKVGPEQSEWLSMDEIMKLDWNIYKRQ